MQEVIDTLFSTAKALLCKKRLENGLAEGNGSGASLAELIWKNAEDLWGDFKHTDFGKVILPFTLLRRLECVLEKTGRMSRRLTKRTGTAALIWT